MSRGPPLHADILHIGTELNGITPLYHTFYYPHSIDKEAKGQKG